MTRRREDEDLQKHTLNLFAGDFQTLTDLTDVDGGWIIRRLVRKYINTIRKGNADIAADELKGLDL